jgi:hypothetical protein
LILPPFEQVSDMLLGAKVMVCRICLATAILLGLAVPVSPARAQSSTVGAIPEHITRYDELVDLIVSTIETDTWEDVGGPGSIRAIDRWNVIVISQTPQVHEKIETLIRVIRRARREQEAGQDVTPPKERPEERRPASLVVESDAEAEARQRIEAALSEKTELDCDETPLREVVAALAKRHNLSIVMDRPALDAVGIQEDTPVTLHVKAVTLRSALRLMLEGLDLSYLVRYETLQFTTRDRVVENLVTRVYKVRDLAIETE